MKFLLPIELDENDLADWKSKLSLAARLALQIGIARTELEVSVYNSLPAIQGQYLLQRYDFLKLEKERNQQRTAEQRNHIPVKGYDRLAIVPIKIVFSNMGRVIDINGNTIPVRSKRYKCYARKGLACVRCGIVGKYFAAERQKNQPTERYHLNLYALVDGKEVMITVDHIIPKSRIDPATGSFGADNVGNMQPMCIYCNGIKGNRTEDELKIGVSLAEAKAKAAEEKPKFILPVTTECGTVCEERG